MKSQNFETRTFGKWILAGEHAVLRGSPALVFPLYSRSLNFKFFAKENKQSSQLIELKLNGSHGSELELLFRGVLEKAFELKNIAKSEIQGLVEISSSIPIGAGLGASAALCVAITRWFQFLGLVSNSEKHEFARELENLFHGESSGVDIAVVTEESGLIFSKNGAKDFFKPAWKPHLYISFSGQKGITYECVKKVKGLVEKNPQLAYEIDERMKTSVQMCKTALCEKSADSFLLLRDAIQLSGLCFEDWELTQGVVKDHMDKLTKFGASAVKPTGSGGGGYVLSLWEKEASAPELMSELIPCFE